MKLKKIFTILLFAGLLTSCDFMDCNESDYYSLEETEEATIVLSNL